MYCLAKKKSNHRQNNRLLYFSSLLILPCLFVLMFVMFATSSILANEIIIPKLTLSKYEIDYCSTLDTEKEFVITLDLGEILPSNLLYDVELVIAFEKEKVQILMPLLIGTLAEQFDATTNAIWDDYSHKYNYYNFQGYKLLAPVYNTKSDPKPLVRFAGKLLVDNIDSTDFSIGYIYLSEEFTRQYVQNKEDTIKLFSKPKILADRIVSINSVASAEEIIFEKEESITEVSYNLTVKNTKFFESFKAEFDIVSNEAEDNPNNNLNFRISDFTINDAFEYDVIEYTNGKLLLDIKVKNVNDTNTNIAEINNFCVLKIERTSNDTNTAILLANISDINKSSCSMISKAAKEIKLKAPYNGAIDEKESNKKFNIDYNYGNKLLVINSSKGIKNMRIINILGEELNVLKESDFIDRFNIKKQIELKNNNIYLIEVVLLDDNCVIRQKMTINN